MHFIFNNSWLQLLWVTLMTVIPVQFVEAGYMECLLVVYVNQAGCMFYII